MPYIINDDLPGLRSFVPDGTDLRPQARSGWREDPDQSPPPVVSDDEPELSATEPPEPVADAAAGEVATPVEPTDQPTEDTSVEQPARRTKKEQ